MSSYSFLIGRPNQTPIFNHPGGENEIAYASDWVPLAWLALFEPRDVQVVEEPPDSQTYDPESKTRCPTLIRKREAALEALQRRRERLMRVLPGHLQAQIGGLEAAVKASTLPYVQTVVSDLDQFVSFPGSEKTLRELVAALDGDDTKQWKRVLAHVDVQMGKDISDAEFSDMTGVAAVVGFLPEQFAVSLSAPAPKVAPAKKAAAKAQQKAAPAKGAAGKKGSAAPAKKPWWKFW